MAKSEWDTVDISVKLETLRKNIDDVWAAYRCLSRDHMVLIERFNDLEEELESLRMVRLPSLVNSGHSRG